jgi:hypothetical protein
MKCFATLQFIHDASKGKPHMQDLVGYQQSGVAGGLIRMGISSVGFAGRRELLPVPIQGEGVWTS